MATKKELVKDILKIESVDTEINLMKKKASELEDILDSLKSVEPVLQEQELTQDLDIKSMMEKMKAEMLAELKEQAKKEVQAEMQSAPIENVEVEEKKPVGKKNIDRFELIPVMNVTNGELIYISKKTGAEWSWSTYGDTEYIEFQELLSMNSGSKRFLHEPFIIILDEDAISYLGLNKMYENMPNFDSIDELFNLNQKEFQEIIEKSPKGIQFSIVARARQLVEQNELDSVKKIKYLNGKFNTDIGERG